MKMKSWAWTLVFSFAFLSASAARADDVRERLNKIFYWQLSDDLKLSTKQEKEMIAIIESIQKRREAALNARATALETLRKLGKMPSSAASTNALAQYRKALTELGVLDVEEYEKLKALLGPETLARFYIVREEVLRKVREALRHAEQPPASK